MKIFLDDERKSPAGWEKTRFPELMIHFLDKYEVKEISLDHDLGDDEFIGTGYDVLLWIEEKVYNDENYNPPKINIHTANSSARIKMEMAVKNINKILSNR